MIPGVVLSMRNALTPRAPARRAKHAHRNARNAAVRAPLLPPVEHVDVASFSRSRESPPHPNPHPVRSARNAAIASPVASRKPRSSARHCRTAQIAEEIIECTETRHRGSRVDARKLFDGERVRDVVRADAAVGLGNEMPMMPASFSLREELARKECSRSQRATFGAISRCAISAASARDLRAARR